MKKFESAEIVELNVNETAFGPYNNEVPDSEKTTVTDANGNVLGYKQQFGEKES